MKLPAGAGNCDVKSLLSSHAVDRPEVHRELAGEIGSEGHREQHHVAFVALDVLKIFNDHWLLAFVGEKPLKLAVSPAGLVEKVQNERLLLGVECDDSEGMALIFRDREPGLETPLDHLGDGLGFLLINAASSSRVGAVHLVELDRVGASGRGRECYKAAFVVEVVGKGDEGLITASIVPIETTMWDARD